MADHLTIIEAAKYLNRSTKTVRKYIKDGKLTAISDEIPGGHRWIIPLESLEALLASPPTSKGITMVDVQVVTPPQMGMEVLENLVMGMETRLLEAIDRRLEGVLERKKPWWKFW